MSAPRPAPAVPTRRQRHCRHPNVHATIEDRGICDECGAPVREEGMGYVLEDRPDSDLLPAATYEPGCCAACPCQAPRSFAGTWTVFSTGDEMRLVPVDPDISGLGMTADRLARTRWFAWKQLPIGSCELPFNQPQETTR